MNAELYLMGKHISMASRRRRRWLVAAIYGAKSTTINPEKQP